MPRHLNVAGWEISARQGDADRVRCGYVSQMNLFVLAQHYAERKMLAGGGKFHLAGIGVRSAFYLRRMPRHLRWCPADRAAGVAIERAGIRAAGAKHYWQPKHKNNRCRRAT